MAFTKQTVNDGDTLAASWGNHVQTQYDEALPKYYSNTNGEYWRWDNGLQIATRTVDIDLTNGGSQVFAMPETFIGAPTGHWSSSSTSGSAVNVLKDAVLATLSSNEWSFRLAGATGTGTLSVKFTAIGRWK